MSCLCDTPTCFALLLGSEEADILSCAASVFWESSLCSDLRDGTYPSVAGPNLSGPHEKQYLAALSVL